MATFNTLGLHAVRLFDDIIGSPGLVGLWVINEQSGQLLDRGPNRSHLTATGSPTYSTGLSGNDFYGLTFTGSGKYLSGGNLSALNFNRSDPFSLVYVTSMEPALTIWDTFTRGNSSTTLGTSSSGHAWSAQSDSVWGITSNTAYLVTAATSGPSVAVIDSELANGTITLDMTNGASYYGGGIVFRYTDTNNFLWAEWDPDASSGTVAIMKREAGSESTLVSAGAAMDNGTNSLHVQYVGNTINAYFSSNAPLQTTSSFNSSATKVGLRSNGVDAGQVFDNFYMGSDIYILGKTAGYSNSGWFLCMDILNRLRLDLYDSDAKRASVRCESALTTSTATLVGMSYDGSSSASGVTWYKNASSASTNTLENDTLTGVMTNSDNFIVGGAHSGFTTSQGFANPTNQKISFVAIFNNLKTAADFQRWSNLANLG